ncbi:TetR/AcrR family transcriptional regulator [Deinococcus oregonensis]|uniref:TetR/AcrR family transcriptional regulator n=1 Tax=Deinococcus oregonensis TaxID=1805970 RepID=A0ABV6AUG7_9DEIO
MISAAPSSPRERILQAALRLLETEGIEAVSTRAVSAAAEVQPPTIYRHFGDMQGLLNAAATAGFTAYLQVKTVRTPLSDPVEELREGWRMHIEFGLTHPNLYTAMYSSLQLRQESPAALEAAGMLHLLMQRVAEAGRLAVSVNRAAAMVHAAAKGTTLSLLEAPVRDSGLSDLMLETVLRGILTAEPGAAAGGAKSVAEPPSAGQQWAVHAVSLAALLPEMQAPFSEAEQALLLEWLNRLM